MLNDIDASEEWLDHWTASISAQAERASTLSRRVAALTGSAQSPDGSIRVTVGSSGQVKALGLDNRVQQLRGAELARRIMSVIGKAQASLAGKVAIEVRQTVGADTETGRAVIHSFESRFPAQDLDDDNRGSGRGR